MFWYKGVTINPGPAQWMINALSGGSKVTASKFHPNEWSIYDLCGCYSLFIVTYTHILVYNTTYRHDYDWYKIILNKSSIESQYREYRV